MNHYFISDIHLDQSEPEICNAFFKFIQTIKGKAQSLYILGDFFEVWIGDDEQTELQQQVANALKDLHQSGTHIYFMPGNRDFLIGKKFLKQCHAKLLKDPCTITIANQKILLTHGDLLCTHDRRYQIFRRIIRQPFLHWIYYRLPLSFRKAIANSLRNSSKQYVSHADKKIMDVAKDSVAKFHLRYQTNIMIHGHTHLPAIHKDNQKTRIVLAAWHHGGNHLVIKDTPPLHYSLVDNPSIIKKSAP